MGSSLGKSFGIGSCCAVAAGLLAMAIMAGYAVAEDARPKSAPTATGEKAGGEVTLKCNVLSHVHTGEKQPGVFLIAYDGTAEVKAEFDKIMADFYPEKGLDADAAVKLQDQFMARLRYRVDGPLAAAMMKEAEWTVRGLKAVTGVVSVRDGQKWITASRWADATFTFPARMYAPDQPFSGLDLGHLPLKIRDGLTLKCIWVPAGKFLMGEPYWQVPHWQEDPPHVVTLTRGFYMAEHPVTQEMYEAVMGSNPSTVKGPQLPVTNVDCAGMYKFCRLVSEKTGRKVRVPTAAEWEYVARVGTSNPTYAERYADQNSNATAKYDSAPLPVKSKKPNAWGFYDMHSGWWERVSDSPAVLDRAAVSDPEHIPAEDKAEGTRGQKHSHMGKGQWTYPISEIEYIDSGAGLFRFRVVVEANLGEP